MSDYNVDINEEEALRQYLPSGFGKQNQAANVEAQLQRSKRVNLAKAHEVDQKNDHPIHHVEFNPLSPSQVLVICATPRA